MSLSNDELRASYDAMMEHYNDIKQELRRRGGYQYDRWKAGGCAVDDDFVSMYPSLGEIIENLEDDSEDTYKIVRYYAPHLKRASETIKSGVSLEEAQKHCGCEDTRLAGQWFDGYSKE